MIRCKHTGGKNPDKYVILDSDRIYVLRVSAANQKITCEATINGETVERTFTLAVTLGENLDTASLAKTAKAAKTK